jgi:homoserine kinase
MRVLVKVPATSANLGPGFDALGLALDLWNETEFTPAQSFSLHIEGEGAKRLATNEKNLIVRSARKLYESVNKRMPPLGLHCRNRIPLSSGLGSSAAAILTGLLGANALLGSPVTHEEILNLALDFEGHPDNVAPALLGGLVVSTMEEGKVIAHKLTVGADFASDQPGDAGSPFHITVVLPEFNLSTKQARAVLPNKVSIKDAVQNISRAVLLTEAFRTGDLNLLSQAMSDALHQPYRLPLIPGAHEAMEAAKQAGAAAVALSGAGPGLIAFSAIRNPGIGAAMKQTFESAGLMTRIFELEVTQQGAQIDIDESP